jgi:hypothetical protein
MSLIYEKIWNELSHKLNNLNLIMDVFIDMCKVLENDRIYLGSNFLQNINLFEISINYLFGLTNHVFPPELINRLIKNTDVVIPEEMYKNACSAVKRNNDYYIEMYIKTFYEEELEHEEVKEFLLPKIIAFKELCATIIKKYEDFHDL